MQFRKKKKNAENTTVVCQPKLLVYNLRCTNFECIKKYLSYRALPYILTLIFVYHIVFDNLMLKEY